MGLLINIRYGKNTVRVYNQLRMGTLILGPLFVLSGIADFFWFGTTTFQGRVLIGVERIIVDAIFIVIGLLLCRLRLTVLREKRTHDKIASFFCT
jgi:hypothetical protein